MSARDHTFIEERLSVDALGGLEPADRDAMWEAMAAHGPDCAECSRLRAEYREVAGRLAFALEPVPIREALEEETVQLARRQGEAVPLRRPRGGTVGLWLVRRRARRRRTLVSPLVAAVIAAAMFLAGWVIRDLTAAAPFDVANATVVSFRAQPGNAGNLAVAYQPGRAGALVFGSGLNAPPSNRTYELWMFRGGKPIRATCFQPGQGGSVGAYLPTNLSTSQQMAVTVESTTCPSAPTTNPILTADLTRA